MARPFSSNWKLLCPAVVLPLIETGLLRGTPDPQTAAIGPQVTAPPPFDLFHDLRWVSVYHDSWLTLGLELCGIVLLRSLFDAYMVRAAWPGDGAPGLLPAARRATAFYAVAALLLMPWVALMFGFSIIGVSYLFFASLPPVVAVAMLIHRGATSQAAGRWWDWGPRWGSLGLIALAFVWLTVGGALTAGAAFPIAMLAAAGCGVLNAFTYHAMVRGVAAPISKRKRQILVPVAIVMTFAVVVGGAAGGFAGKRTSVGHLSPRAIARIPARAHGHPILVAGGFGSHTDRTPPFDLPRWFAQWRYSYSGMRRERPLPYTSEDTEEPVAVSAARMEEQVDALHAAYRRPVTIVAESEGAIVARYYLLNLYEPNTRAVDRFIALDMPRVRPAVYYPAAGMDGAGLGSGWALRGIALLVGHLGPLRVSADAPFFRSLMDCGRNATSLQEARLPSGVRETQVLALADSVDDYRPFSGARHYYAIATHGGLIHDPEVDDLVQAIVTGSPLPDSSARRLFARLIGNAAAGWTTPTLGSEGATDAGC
ncbi:MAG: hypothetical protein M3290_11550 [Actinomycetota bacterium]|nr:hypothetical protein [Actinomycetota bacterium]